MKVVINRCFGGFGVSALALKMIAEKKGETVYFFTGDLTSKGVKYKPITIDKAKGFFYCFTHPDPNTLTTEQYNEYYVPSRPENRSDPFLVEVVEMLGDKADGACANLKVVEVPDGLDYEIDEYDGMETIAEQHRTWF